MEALRELEKEIVKKQREVWYLARKGILTVVQNHAEAFTKETPMRLAHVVWNDQMVIPHYRGVNLDAGGAADMLEDVDAKPDEIYALSEEEYAARADVLSEEEVKFLQDQVKRILSIGAEIQVWVNERGVVNYDTSSASLVC